MTAVPVYEYFSSGISLQQFKGLCLAAGGEHIHVSIISGRCGSTLLSHITKKVGFGWGEEPFNEWPEELLHSWAAPHEFDKFLFKLIEASAVDNRFYFQIDPLRLDALSHLLPGGDNAPFPNVAKFTVLLRRNIVSQALSYFNAYATGLWHSNQGKGDAISTGEFTEQRILYWIEHIHRMEQKIVEMFPAGMPDTYFYEDLAASPFETITLFLQRSEFAVRPIFTAGVLKDDAAPQKLLREDYAVQYISVINKYPWLRDVLSERNAGMIPSPMLERMIIPTDNLGNKLSE